MRLVSLPDAGMGLSRAEIADLFRPFEGRHVASDDPEWQEEVRRRDGLIWKRLGQRVFRGLKPRRKRTLGEIKREYAKVWRKDESDGYDMAQPVPKYSPWEWDGRLFFANKFGGVRVRLLLMMRTIERLRPARMLEVGYGNGMNLVYLASCFPQVEFHGIELTDEGVAAARAFQARDELPRRMHDFSPLPVRDPTAFKRIRFLQGNAAALPFEDGSIDLVLTVLALEQMESIRDRALSEIGRVARGHALMIEPFRDMNPWGRRAWRNVMARDYFRGHIADLPRYGLDPVWAVGDMPQELFLRVCAVLAQRRR